MDVTYKTLCVCVCLGSECSVQISNAAAAPPAASDPEQCGSAPVDGRVTRGVQTLPRSAHASRPTSSHYHTRPGGSLTRHPAPATVDKQVGYRRVRRMHCTEAAKLLLYMSRETEPRATCLRPLYTRCQ